MIGRYDDDSPEVLRWDEAARRNQRNTIHNQEDDQKNNVEKRWNAEFLSLQPLFPPKPFD